MESTRLADALRRHLIIDLDMPPEVVGCFTDSELIESDVARECCGETIMSAATLREMIEGTRKMQPHLDTVDGLRSQIRAYAVVGSVTVGMDREARMAARKRRFLLSY